MRRIGRVWSVVAVAVVALAAGAFAATTTPSAAKHTSGTVESYDAATSVVDVKASTGVEKISVDAATKISERGKSIQVSELKKGEHVKVEWTDKDGHKVASKIYVMTAPAKAAVKKGSK